MGDLFSALIDHIIGRLLLVGAVLGLGAGAIIWLIVYLCHHITIGWKP